MQFLLAVSQSHKLDDEITCFYHLMDNYYNFANRYNCCDRCELLTNPHKPFLCVINIIFYVDLALSNCSRCYWYLFLLFYGWNFLKPHVSSLIHSLTYICNLMCEQIHEWNNNFFNQLHSRGIEAHFLIDFCFC
jgi:hypothetical protein